MSVLIKGMDMPLDCSNCDFCRIVDGHYYCNRTKHKISVYYGSRQGDCPIINILAPHGRLIDENELLRHKYGFSQTARVIIKTTDAVIEAEE